MLMPDRAPNMGDGWETKRRRGPGHDWAVVRLGVESTIRRVEVDTAHFKGNYPDTCSIDAALNESEWKTLLPQMKLNPDHRHVYERELEEVGPATRLRLNIYPDGGISRFRVFGVPTPSGRRRALLQLVNAMTHGEARAALQDCCGAPRWLGGMLSERPFDSAEALFAASEKAFSTLSREDWLEALRHHPRIGERKADRTQSAQSSAWSAKEQSGIDEAGRAELAEMARLNRDYENRFGFVFLICATGRTLTEMTAALRQRLTNDPDTELAVAAAEHRRITKLRLEKLLT
jgi:allantoicase